MGTFIAIVLTLLAATGVVMGVGCWLLIRAAHRVRTRVSRRVQTVRAGVVRPTGVPAPWAAQVPPLPTRRAFLSSVSARLPGPKREVAQVRRDLQREMRGAAQAVHLGLRDGRPVAPLARLVGHLQRSATELDTDLAVVAADPDRSRQASLVAEQQPRIDALLRACEQVRRGVLLAGSAASGPLLPGILDELDDEVIRLGLWAQAHRELNGH